MWWHVAVALWNYNIQVRIFFWTYSYLSNRAPTILLYYKKLDHIPSSCIVITVHNMVKVVNIVRAQCISHIDAGALIAEMESETESQPR